jgi:hypothetical protein
MTFSPFFRHFAGKQQSVRVCFYAMVPSEKASIRTLIDWLDYNDYAAIAKLGRTVIDDTSRYRPLVAGVQQMGGRVSVVSTLQPRPMIAEELRRQADQFIDLADLRDQFERGKTAAATAA